jgi:hypothetical protein
VFVLVFLNLFSYLAQPVANKQQKPQRNAGVSLSNRHSGQTPFSSHLLLNEPGWALNVFWLPAGREEDVRCGRTKVRRRQTGLAPRPDAPRWNQRSDCTDPLPGGRSASESTTEMTGTNYILDAARHGPERPRQLLREERPADGNPFFHCPLFHLTAHASSLSDLENIFCVSR